MARSVSAPAPPESIGYAVLQFRKLDLQVRLHVRHHDYPFLFRLISYLLHDVPLIESCGRQPFGRGDSRAPTAPRLLAEGGPRRTSQPARGRNAAHCLGLTARARP
jgi:hypothetical protein